MAATPVQVAISAPTQAPRDRRPRRPNSGTSFASPRIATAMVTTLATPSAHGAEIRMTRPHTTMTG